MTEISLLLTALFTNQQPQVKPHTTLQPIARQADPLTSWMLRYVRVTKIFLCRGGHWDFRALRFWLFFRSVFCAKRLRFFGFGVRCGLRISRFLTSGFRFSWKIILVFRFYYPMWFVFGFRFWSNFLAVLDDFFVGFAVSNILQCPPLCCFSLKLNRFPTTKLAWNKGSPSCTLQTLI